ncbi:MAG: hypothetical protein JWL81_155 [Verrucomicrobiales bacterium]|nr:hypothetical protein [Verrucomicrobiales bacterium]
MKRFPTLLSALILTCVPASHGAIISSGVQDIALPQSFFVGIYVNVLTQVTSSVLPSDFDTAPWIGFDLGGVDISNGDFLRPVVTGSAQVSNLTIGTSVGSPSNLMVGAGFSDNHTGPAADQFQLLSVGYVGFAFGPGGGAPQQYGWARITIDNTGTGTLHEWAYESEAGTAITVGAGAVPEPSGAALGLLAGAALLARRRRA